MEGRQTEGEGSVISVGPPGRTCLGGFTTNLHQPELHQEFLKQYCWLSAILGTQAPALLQYWVEVQSVLELQVVGGGD